MKLFYKCVQKKKLQSNHFILEAVQPEHIQNIRKWRNEQIDFLRQTNPISGKEQDLYFKNEVWTELACDEPKQILFSFLLNEKLIGYGGLVHISWKHMRAEISFICDTGLIGKNQLYRKYFLSFLEMIKDLSFNVLNLNKLFTETFSFRKKQIHILEDFGMKVEGVLKDNHKINGKYFDSVIQSILNK